MQRANRQQHKSFIYAVFSLSFSSSGERQYLTGKAKNALLKVWWGEGGGEGGGREVGSCLRDVAPLSLGKLETSFSYNVQDLF